MASINIQTVSNKSEFTNYFSEPITFPKNSMMTLSKANLKLPVVVSPLVQVPDVSGDWTSVAFRVEIDGIHHNVLWDDIYNAHNDLPGAEFFFNRDDWAQNYVYLPCNQIILYNNATNQGEVKTDFNTILARAITNKFAFYSVSPAPTYKFANTESGKRITTGAILVNPADARTFTPIDYTCNLQSQIGFNVDYAPFKVMGRNETYINVNNEDKVGWIQGAALHGFKGDGLSSCCCFAEQMDFDYNGGWITTFPNALTNNPNAKMAWGIQLLGQGSQAGDDKLPITTYDTKLIDYGIEFGYDATAPGHYVYNIIEPPQLFNSDAGGPGGEATQHTKFNPNVKVNRFNNNGDHFFIQIQRGNALHNTKGFVVNILHGVNNDPHNDPNAVVIYSANININPQQHINPVYIANTDAGTDQWEFNSNAYIPKTQDTLDQGDLTYEGNNNEFGTMSIEPRWENTNLLLTQQSFNFWKSWGFFSKNDLALGDLSNQRFIKVEGTDLVRLYKQNTALETSETYYFLGYQDFTDIWEYDEDVPAGNAFLTLKTNNAVDDLPQNLNVSINNLDIRNFNGTFPYGIASDGITTIVNSSASDSRVVGTIPIPINEVGILSQDIDLTYEPFSLLYRPLTNPNNFTVNKLDIELFYKDFFLNRKRSIKSTDGTINLEFHVKSGGAPTINNNLRPY